MENAPISVNLTKFYYFMSVFESIKTLHHLLGCFTYRFILKQFTMRCSLNYGLQYNDKQFTQSTYSVLT